MYSAYDLITWIIATEGVHYILSNLNTTVHATQYTLYKLDIFNILKKKGNKYLNKKIIILVHVVFKQHQYTYLHIYYYRISKRSCPISIVNSLKMDKTSWTFSNILTFIQFIKCKLSRGMTYVLLTVH